jgi:hypothetical protein
MTTPTHMQIFEMQLAQAVKNCFPGSETEVEYWGSRETGHAWRVTVDGRICHLTQEQAGLTVGGRRDDLRALFK